MITTTNAKVRFVINNALDYQLDQLVMVIKIVQMGYIVTLIPRGHILVLVKRIDSLNRLAIMITSVQMICSAGLTVQPIL